MASVNGKNTDKAGEITPQERARVEASIRGLEQAPSSRQQLGAFTNWRQVQDQLGQPFNNERIPLSKLKLMRRDPMLAFGMHYQKMPLVKAPWYIDSTDVQLAAFIDATLRPIMASYIISHAQKLDMGFQAMAKRFQLKAPEGTYVDESGNEQPIWNQTGGIQPVTLKPFVPLPPEGVEPMFDEATGEFSGIKYKPPQGSAPGKAKAKGPGGSQGELELDLYHSLWVTNEIESVYGNLFGYPRLGYAYPYWWSYWYRWAIADRAFEKKGDPPVIVRHPEGEIDLGDGQTISNSEYALLMAERLRAGAAIALPSQPYTNFEDRPSAVREWEIEFLKGGVDMEPFDSSFDYMDVMKLRSIFVPEQALIEGGGGTSSRNVAEEMFEGLVKGQTLQMEEIVESLNRWVIPHLIMVNFPEKFDQGISAQIKVRGFSSSDTELLSQIVQLVGQEDPDKLGIDIREALRQLNMPLLPEGQYQANLKIAAEKAAAEGPGLVAPTTTSVGVVPTPGKAPSTGTNTPGPASATGGSFTGFTYVPPVGLAIELSAVSEAAASFMSDLPPSIHYQDSGMRSLTKQLWNAMQKFYAAQYKEFRKYLEAQEAEVQLADEKTKPWVVALADEDGELEIDFAMSDVAREVGRKVVNAWPGNIELLDETTNVVRNILERMIDRASEISRKEAGLEKRVSTDDSTNWVSARVTDLVGKSVRSLREELSEFVGNAFHLNEGAIDPKDLAKQVEAHYGDFPEWMASRFSRSETRDAYNVASLLTARRNGLDVVQAIDALGINTDRHCEERDGQFFTIDQALQEEEHPGGTLGWRLVKEPVTLSRVETVPDAPAGSIGRYDPESHTIFLSTSADQEDERKLLLAVGEKLS